MRRYWLESPILNEPNIGKTVTLEGELFHHIVDVCRQHLGSRFELLNQSGYAHLVEIIELKKKSAVASILERRQIPALPRPHIHLALSISRFPVMDSVVEKMVEMGVHSLHPFFSEFSFVGSLNKLPDNKVDRWQKILISATQQCGRGELMKIHPARPLKEIFDSFNRTKGQRGLFAYEGAGKKTLRQQLREWPSEDLQEIWVFVGSEGGFSHQEVEGFQQQGLEPVTLGPQVLRVETACITLAGILKYEFTRP